MTEKTATSSIFTHFKSVKDPRVTRCKKHKLADILFMTLSAVICSADNWIAIDVMRLPCLVVYVRGSVTPLCPWYLPPRSL